MPMGVQVTPTLKSLSRNDRCFVGFSSTERDPSGGKPFQSLPLLLSWHSYWHIFCGISVGLNGAGAIMRGILSMMYPDNPAPAICLN